MPWVKLDDSFWANPKVVAAGNEVAGAYVRMLSYCGQQLTDGEIAEEPARFIAKAPVTKKLVGHGFVEASASGFLIPDYLDFNPSREKVEATRKARAEAGKRGGEASSK
jgi:hypothetical protein